MKLESKGRWLEITEHIMNVQGICNSASLSPKANRRHNLDIKMRTVSNWNQELLPEPGAVITLW